MMINGGNAWNYAKKYIEDGNFGGENSETYRNAIIGDVLGKSFIDTSAPSINILIKIMSVIALVIATTLR